MLHLQNSACSTKLAFYAPSELSNSLSLVLSFVCEWVSIVIYLRMRSWKRQTDNGAVSNFGPLKRGVRALNQKNFRLLCCHPWPFAFALWPLAFSLGPLSPLGFEPFGPFGPLGPFALRPLALFGPFGSLALWLVLAPWPFWPFSPFGPLALLPLPLYSFDPFGSLVPGSPGALAFSALAFSRCFAVDFRSNPPFPRLLCLLGLLLVLMYASKASFAFWLCSHLLPISPWEEARRCLRSEPGGLRPEAGGRRPMDEGRRAKAEGCWRQFCLPGSLAWSSLSWVCRSGRTMPCHGATCSGSQRLRRSLGGWSQTLLSRLWMRLTQACLHSMCLLQSLMVTQRALRKVTHLSIKAALCSNRLLEALGLRGLMHCQMRKDTRSRDTRHATWQTASLIDRPRAIHVPSRWCQAWGYIVSGPLLFWPAFLKQDALTALPESSVSRGLTSRIKCVFEVFRRRQTQSVLTPCALGTSHLQAQCWQCQNLGASRAVLLRRTLSAYEWRWTRGQLSIFWTGAPLCDSAQLSR